MPFSKKLFFLIVQNYTGHKGSCCTNVYDVHGYANCRDNEGDCDEDYECEGSLKCGSYNCNWPDGNPSNEDCCYEP